ncbi:hypothetical protein [Streptomyces phaeochromogenes]|uniref:hypothetical protein n=1 Tax=Streptomyces phaeochromogenes TaxID=1923 RepID=UPI00371976AB
MPRGRHRHSPPLHRLLPPSAIAGVSAVCAAGPWLFSETLVLRGLAAGAAATAVAGAVVMRRWDAAAGKRVADLTRARASDEWRHEERAAELETDLDESRELRTKLEQRLRSKRAELQGLRNEHAALLRRYATAETERATALEGRRLLEIEATAPARALPAAASIPPDTDETASVSAQDAVPEATAATVQAALAASAAASVLYVKANAALDRLAKGAVVGTADAADAAGATEGAGSAGDSAEVVAEDGAPAEAVTAEDGSATADSTTVDSTRADSTTDPATDGSSATEAGTEAEDIAPEAADSASASAEDGSAQDDTAADGSGQDAPAPSPAAKAGPVKRTTTKGGGPKGSPSPGGPGKRAPRPNGSPNGSAKGASAAGSTVTGAPAKGDAGQEGETRGKPEAVGGHERTAAATAPISERPAKATQPAETVRPHARATATDVSPQRSTATDTTTATAPKRSAAIDVTPLQSTATRTAPAPEPSPGTALARPTPSEVARVQRRPETGATTHSSTSAAALTPAARPAGHFTVPTAVAVAPASPARRPSVEGGFDFFGTQKGEEALEAVQNEDLADVVGQEALALHKAESESEFKPVSEESRGVGQVIDLTAHDETEQIDLAELRSAVS